MKCSSGAFHRWGTLSRGSPMSASADRHTLVTLKKLLFLSPANTVAQRIGTFPLRRQAPTGTRCTRAEGSYLYSTPTQPRIASEHSP